MKTYFIKTFGCQANEADSEKIAGFYQSQGYKPAENIETADVVIINTCSVRQSAENRVAGLIINLTDKNKRQKIILAGCVLRYGISDLKKRYPQVDEFLRVSELKPDAEPIRQDKKEALVSIMEGCNNFCSYCAVPYARGREKSRLLEDIVCEVEKLVGQGYNQIVLLGQNVNSYGKDLRTQKDKEVSFAKLLKKLNEVFGLEKIKFLTSNPWDLTKDIIQSIKLPKVEKYLHLAVQSGDDEILKRMNRPYTALQYLDLIKEIKKEIREMKIGTDVIVGFPGETEEQFQKTVDLCRKADFSIAYVNKYSPRPGTVAYKLKDDVVPSEKKRRWQIIDQLVNKK